MQAIEGSSDRVTSFFAVGAFLIAALVCTTALAQHDSDTPAAAYRFGVFPYLSPRNTIELYGPVGVSMSRTLGVPVKLESTASFSSFLEVINAGVYDIALIQPFNYIEVVDKHGYLPLARMAAPLVTQFFVRDDSHYKTLDDLRGTTVAMPPALAANARMALRALHDHNLLPGRDLNVRYYSSHDSCIQQVWIGNASACGTARPPIAIYEQRMKARFRPIHDTPAIPHILFVAHPRVPAADRARLRDLIVGWSGTDDGRELLKDLGFPGFVPVQPGEYQVMREYELAAPAVLATRPADTIMLLGVFPYLPARQLADQLAPLSVALTSVTARDVQLRTAGSFGNFLDNVANGAYDFILVQPFDFRFVTEQGYVPLARVESDIVAEVIVRADSRYRRPADLRGEIVAMPPFESAMSRLGRSGLKAGGLVPGRDIKVDYRRDHESCLQQVQQRHAAACVTTRLALTMLGKETASELRSLGEIGKVPGVVFLAHPRVPESARARVRTELLSWAGSDTGRKLIRNTHLGPFVRVNPADYLHLPQTEESH